MLKSKYTIKKGNAGESVLNINGAMSRCPFTPPFPVQNLGGMGMAHLPCTTTCPHAGIKQEDGQSWYVITCGANIVQIELEDEYSDELPNIKSSPFSVV